MVPDPGMLQPVEICLASCENTVPAPCDARGVRMQWLESLSKEERQKYLLDTMDLMVSGTIKPPPPSEPTPLCVHVRGCHMRHAW